MKQSRGRLLTHKIFRSFFRKRQHLPLPGKRLHGPSVLQSFSPSVEDLYGGLTLLPRSSRDIVKQQTTRFYGL